MKLESSVTLFDDNKVEDRFAELQVTADGITAEVGRKVGNDEVISRINQTPETITIHADKVDIEGTITAINDNTTTTINGGKITTNTINGDRIVANTVNGNRLIANTVSAGAIKADSGTFNTANIPNLSANKITSDTLDGARINVMGASNGARAALTSTGLDIYNSSNQRKASYGSNAVIYGGAGTYPLISVTGSSAYFMQSANNYASVDSYGLEIYQDGISVAEFGSSNRIGDYNHKHIQITNTDLNVYDDDGSIPFQVSTATSSTTEPYEIAWYIKANSSYTTQAYFKGTIVNNTVSVGVAASGVPTASDTITLTNAGTPYTITVSGVKYTFTRYNGIVTYSIQNTNSAKRSCLVSFTQSYRKTTVKENSHTLDTRYQVVSIEDVTGTCYSANLYTYAGVAQLTLRVYHGSSSVSNGGLIYKGVLGGYAPIYDCYMVGHINGVYAVSGTINSQGQIFVYNTSGGSRTVSSSNYATLSATYLLAQ